MSEASSVVDSADAFGDTYINAFGVWEGNT